MTADKTVRARVRSPITGEYVWMNVIPKEPMTTDDVRASFEAEFRGGYDLQRDAAGTYLDNYTRHAWWGYRAAHADLSGEVRELVEAAGRAANWHRAQATTIRTSEHYDEVIGERMALRHDRQAKGLDAALAKFTQEKP